MLNGTLAVRYGVGAVIIAAAAWWIGSWGWLLIWLAVSFASQALAYAGMGTMVFQKREGRLPWVVRILLAPYMIIARITLYYYCKGLPASAEVARGVWIGRRLNGKEAEDVVRPGVTASLDLTAGFPETEALRKVAYHNIQLMPITVPTVEQLRDAVRFIDEQSKRGVVYVHGALGYSRSVGTVAAYMLASGMESTVASAVERVRKLVPQTLLDDVWMRRLEEFRSTLPKAAAGRA